MLVDPALGHPDQTSFRLKLGLLIPATNTSMEHGLWHIIGANPDALAGVGVHTSPVKTPSPRLATEEDLLAYRRQFIGGLADALGQAILAEPDYLILGMSLEHVISGLEEIREPVAELETRGEIGVAGWHEAATAALHALGARRLGLLTPFDARGNTNATQMFEDLGFEVAASVGFCCAHAMHIAQIPDQAKERAISELLATADNRLDAVIQCGTNMSVRALAERLEPALGIPVLDINPVLL